MAWKHPNGRRAIVVIEDDEPLRDATKGTKGRRLSPSEPSPTTLASGLQKNSKNVTLESHRPTVKNSCNYTEVTTAAFNPAVHPPSPLQTFLTERSSLPNDSGLQEPLSNLRRSDITVTSSAPKPVSGEEPCAKSSTKSHPSTATRTSGAEDIIEDDIEDGSQSEEDLREWLAQQSRFEARRKSANPPYSPANGRKSSTAWSRNLPVVSPFSTLEKVAYKEIALHPKNTVELEDEDFLRIVEIIQDVSTSMITLRGWRFRRSKLMNGLLERKLNELCWILHVDQDDTRDVNVQGMDTVSITEVRKRRRLRITNQLFPALSWREDSGKDTDETVINDRVLVCRWKYICFYPDAKARECCDHIEKALCRVQADECDKGLDNEMTDFDIRKAWRGNTIEGGSQAGWLPGEKEFLRQEELSHKGIQSRSSLKQSPDRHFPMGDPMQRGCVGYFLDVSDLQAMSPIDGESELKTVASPLPLNLAPKQHLHGRTIPSSLPIDSIILSDEESDSGLKPVLISNGNAKDSSLLTSRPRRTAPQIVEMNAQFKTSTSSGIFESTYKGKITSTFSPAPADSKRKRVAAEVLEYNTRPSKRINSDPRFPSRPDMNNPYIRCSPSSSDSSGTFGRSESPQSIQEIKTPRESLKIVEDGRDTFASDFESRDESTRPSHSDRTISPFLQPLPKEQLRTRISTETSKPSNSHSPRTGIVPQKGIVIDLTIPQPKSFVSGARRNSFASVEQRPKSHFSVNRPQPNVLRKISTTDSTTSNISSKHGSYTVATPMTSREGGLASPTVRPNNTVPSSRLSSRSICPPARVVIAGQRSDAASPKQLTSVGEKDIANVHHFPPRRYTMIDSFCGAGGMSRGAVMAGLRVTCAFDFNASACESYAMNNFGTAICNVWAHEFSGSTGDYKVDILHLSPPCQFFSDAHTIEGKDDEMNTASLFAIGELLEKAKPRVVTLEQTAGLVRRHRIFFNAVVRMFTDRGFGMRWRLLNCADFGLPQRRLRLFIIASCPGEPLPPFPTPTHSEFPNRTNLSPWTTITNALASIPAHWPDHSPTTAHPRTAPPQSGDKLAPCITTSGGGIIHPSGTRDYTIREFACLQGFPLGHKFSATGVKKQIGNAVPPLVAEVILQEVKRGLMRADGLL